MEIDDGLAPYLVNNGPGSAGLQSKVFFFHMGIYLLLWNHLLLSLYSRGKILSISIFLHVWYLISSDTGICLLNKLMLCIVRSLLSNRWTIAEIYESKTSTVPPLPP